ncbi:MAG: ribonuclease P protein component [Solirubrobacterales bacterium]
MRHRRPRLTRSADFDRVYRRGRSAASRCFVVYAFSAGSEEPHAGGAAGRARLGVSVGRRVGGAVERNGVKRMLREAFWSLESSLPADHDFVIVARSGAGDVVSRDGHDGVRRELAELLERLGWAAGEQGEGSP